MKGFVILVIVLIIGFIIYAAGRKQEIEKQNSAKKPPVNHMVQGSAPQQNIAKKSTAQKEHKPSASSKPSNDSNSGGISKEITDTINYGTGYTQVKAGNNAKNKIQNIQQQQNQRHQKALGD